MFDRHDLKQVRMVRVAKTRYGQKTRTFVRNVDLLLFLHPTGSFEVNPPFVEAMYLAVAEHCTELLAAADAHGKALTFAIIVGATEAAQTGAAWEALRSSWCVFENASCSRHFFPSLKIICQDRLGIKRKET
jgi:hypothetical protein